MTVRFEISATMNWDELGELWRDLEQRAACSFFVSWDWIGPWLREVTLSPVILIGRMNGSVVLLGALVPGRRCGIFPAAIHGLHLHSTGKPESDIVTIEHNGFLVDSSVAREAVSGALGFLLSGATVGGHRCDELHLRGIADPQAEIAVSSGHQVSSLQRQRSWCVSLSEIRASGRQYLDCLSANTRQQIRRSIRRYERCGALSIDRASNAHDALEFLDGLKALHQRYWVGRGQPGSFGYPFFERFHRRLIQTCVTRGTAELLKVSAGVEVVGYLYNFCYRGHIYAYQTGFRYNGDPHLKPGLVSHSLCIARHLDEGGNVYDFMAGEARYKANLGTSGPDLSYLLVQRRTWPIRAENAMRDLRRRLHTLTRPGD